MNADNWGLCKECKWFQVEPEAEVEDKTMGLCIEEELQPYRIRVSGNSGCAQFAPGEVAHAAGSSSAPPIAEPTR